jgi:hypothetical protein
MKVNNNQKKKGPSKKKGGFLQHEIGARQDVVVYKVPSQISPFPPRYRTIVTTAMRGYVNAGTGAVVYYCKANSAHLPFAGGGWPGTSPAAATLKPTGFPQVCNSSFYTLFRVVASHIKVQLSPGDAADSMQLSITPSGNNATPASAAAAMGQRLTKWRQIQIGTPVNSQTVHNSVAMCDFLGVTASAVQNDLSGDFIGNYAADPADLLYWVINIQPDNGGVSSTIAALTVEMQHEIEFFGETAAQQPEALVEGTPKTKPNGKFSLLGK